MIEESFLVDGLLSPDEYLYDVQADNYIVFVTMPQNRMLPTYYMYRNILQTV